MLFVLDYIIANEDRHLNNFGLLRNAETLEWIRMAPIYDSGSSLGYDKVAGQIRSERDVEDLITNTLSAEGAKEYMDDNRIKAIAETANRRIQNLMQLSMTQAPVQTNSTEDDVEENIAQDYSPKLTL